MAIIDIAAAKAARNVIYAIAHTPTGKQYVGQTRETLWKRWQAHRNAAQSEPGATYKTRTLIAKAMRAHGVTSFALSVLETVTDPADLDAREMHWIAALGTLGPGGYNLCAGGKTSLRIASVGAQIAAANRGRVKTPQWRAALSAAHTGKVLSAAHRAKVGDAQRGRRQSEESKAKRSVALKGRKIAEPYSQERRDKIAATLTGRKLSPETIAKRTAKQRGLKRSAATCENQRLAALRRHERERAALNGGQPNHQSDSRRESGA